MLPYIASTAIAVQLNKYRNATHIELSLHLHSRTNPPNVVAMSPVIFTALSLKAKRNNIYVPKDTGLMLPLPLLDDLRSYNLQILVSLVEIVKDKTILSDSVSISCSESTFESICAGVAAEEVVFLGGSQSEDFVRLTLSHHQPLHKVKSGSHECLRLDAFILTLSDVVLPVSKLSLLAGQPLQLRICTEASASAFPLVELPQTTSTTRNYRLASPTPIYVPNSPVINLQIVLVYSISSSPTHFRLNNVTVGKPSTISCNFSDYIPLYQLSIREKRILYDHQAGGIPITLSFPPTLASSDFISFCDVIHRALQCAADPAAKKSVRAVSELLQNMNTSVIPRIFVTICFRGGETANVFSSYESKWDTRSSSKDEASRCKAYDNVFKFVGLTDTLLTSVGQKWTDLTTQRGAMPTETNNENKLSFVLTPLLDMFEPNSTLAAKRNGVTYPDFTDIPDAETRRGDASSPLYKFESLNCASRARDMIYISSTKLQAKGGPKSCLTMLLVDSNITNNKIKGRNCVYTIRFCKDSQNDAEELLQKCPVAAVGPEQCKQNYALWQFTLEKKQNGAETLVAGPVIDANQIEQSLELVLSGCRANNELIYPRYLWILPQVLPLPDAVVSHQLIRDRVEALENYSLSVNLYDFATGQILANGSLRMNAVISTFVTAATLNLDVEIKLKLFYNRDFTSDIQESDDNITFLASCYGFLKELQPLESKKSSSEDSALVHENNQTENASDPIISRAETPDMSVIDNRLEPVAVRQASSFSPTRRNIADCPIDISNIEHVSERDLCASFSTKLSKTPRLLTNKEIDIVDGTVTLRFEPMQERNDITGETTTYQRSLNDAGILRQLVHKLRKELELITPKTFRQAAEASPSTYAGLEHVMSEDLRKKLEICTGVSLTAGSTAYIACQTISEKLDKNILSYFLVEMIKQNVQLTKELDSARDKTSTNTDMTTKLKALVLEQEQLLQYMEKQNGAAARRSADLAERLATVERENCRLNCIVQTLANSLGNVGAADPLLAIERNNRTSMGTRSLSTIEDGKSAVLMSVKLPPGRLPPLSPQLKG